MLNSFKNKKVVSVYKPIEFPVIINETLSSEYDVVAAARQQAKKNLPDSNSLTADSNEINYKTKLQTQVIQASHSVQQSLNNLGNEIHNLSINQQLTDAESIPEEFKQAIKAEITPMKRELRSLKSKLDLADEDLEQFKSKNKLNREADYPTSRWKTFGVLLIALITEGMLNGFFFADGSDSGLLGGIVIALIVAALNISFGFLLGWKIIPIKNHIIKWKSNLSVIFSVILLLIPLIFNLFIAHYREALIKAPDDASSYVFESINNGWFAVSDLNSWLLFGVGIIFFILASYKGYSVDDVYPGYGKFARLRDQALDMLNEEREYTLLHIDEKYEDSSEVLDKCYDYIKKQSISLSNSISSFQIQDTIFKNYYRHIENALKYIIKLYRDTNSAERETPPPTFFETDSDFSLDFEPLHFSHKDKREELIQAKEKLEDSLPLLRKNLVTFKKEFHEEIDEICHS
jgi:hypothetical protein